MQSERLSSGYDVPVVGLGTWQVGKAQGPETLQTAIDVGYRHIDCAYMYENEAEVGAGIQAKIKDGTVKREDLFVTGKLWNTHHKCEDVRKECLDSTNKLGLAYLDLYLMHWPISFQEGDNIFPVDTEGHFVFADADYLDTYKEMEKLVDEGMVRSIGLSNFNETQIQRVFDNCRIKPAMHQFETHPYLNVQRLVDFSKKMGMAVTAYSPLGSPDRPWAAPNEKRLLADPAIMEIAAKYNKSAAQVLIRYAVERGMCVAVKSVTPSRMKENLQVMDFKLSTDDMARLNNMDTGFRALDLAELKLSKDYPY